MMIWWTIKDFFTCKRAKELLFAEIAYGNTSKTHFEKKEVPNMRTIKVLVKDNGRYDKILTIIKNGTLIELIGGEVEIVEE